jgi:DNA-binding SARP family transcriptional activator
VSLEIKLFGALRVQRPGQPVSRFPTRRVKDLFSYLLIRRHALHAREALADLFWDPTEESNPRHCLNTALWRLNRTLGEPEAGDHPFLRVDAQHIGFNTASDCRLDIAEFENRCLWADQMGDASPDQRAALYRQAISLYQADLLVDCYEEWCLRERERLRQMYLRALEHVIGYHASRGEHVESIDAALRFLACDALNEEVHRKLMRAYLESNQAPAALKQYQDCQATLQREFSTILAPETKAMLPEILRRTGIGSAGTGAGAGAGGAMTNGGLDAGAITQMTVVGLPTSAEATPSLAVALAQLGQAVADFDRAQAQLRQAATSVEHIAQHLLGTSSGGATHPSDEVVLTEQVVRARLQLASATARAKRALATTAA